MGNVTINGKPLTLIGALPSVGSRAPDFTLTKHDLIDIERDDFSGQPLLLNIFPSIDTPTCATSVRRFNELASKHPDITILCISADLPFAQNRFCGIEGIENVQAMSTFRFKSFGRDYGVEILDGPLAGLLSRSIVLLNADHHVTYTELVAEMSHEPDYQTALSKIQAL